MKYIGKLLLPLSTAATALAPNIASANCPAPDGGSGSSRTGTTTCVVRFAPEACPNCRPGWRHKCEASGPLGTGAWRPVDECLPNELRNARSGISAQQRAGAAYSAQAENFRSAPQRERSRQEMLERHDRINDISRQIAGAAATAQNQRTFGTRGLGGASTDAGSGLHAQAGCGGYPLQSRGAHPSGYVCRCVYGGPSNQPGWWAVEPGNPQASLIACGPPRDGNAPIAVTADDEDRQQEIKRQQWQQSQIEQQRIADRHSAQQQQQQQQQQQIKQKQQASRRNSQNRDISSLRPAYSQQAEVGINELARDVLGYLGTVRTYAVKIENTGNVRLQCEYAVSGDQAKHGSGRCVNPTDCVSLYRTKVSTIINPGQSKSIGKFDYYLGNGKYSGECVAAP